MKNVVILAAGFGTRLKGKGLQTPKGLIRYKNTTILGRMVEDLLKANSINNIILVSNSNFYKQYREWIKKNDPVNRIQIINNNISKPSERLGAIGDLIYAIDKLKINGNILVLPSDTLYNFKISEFLEFAHERNCFSTVFRYVEDKNIIKNRYGCAVIKNNFVVSFEEKPNKPKGNYLAIPFYYYPKDTLRFLKIYKKEGGNLDAPGSIIGWIIENKIPVYGFITNNKSLDVGTKKELNKITDF